MSRLEDYWANPPAYCSLCALYCCAWYCDAHDPDGDGHCANAVPLDVVPSELAMRLESAADRAYERIMPSLQRLADGTATRSECEAIGKDFERKRRVFIRRLQSEYRKQFRARQTL